MPNDSGPRGGACAGRWVAVAAALVAGCAAGGGQAARDQSAVAEQAAAQPAPPQPARPAAPAQGPTLRVRYSVMAEVLHLAEGVSIWRRDMPRTLFAVFEERFGLDPRDRELIKRFALVRHALWQRTLEPENEVSFAKPFGPHGLFPRLEPDAEDRYYQAVLAAPEPAALRRGMAGVLEPADAEAVAALLQKLAPRVGRLIESFGGYRSQAAALERLLAGGRVPELLHRLGRFCGVETESLTFRVHPVWMPAGQPVRARAHGDTILLELPEGSGPGPAAVGAVVGAVLMRLLARVEPSTQVLVTNRFVEKAGHPGRGLRLLGALRDAAGIGLAAPLVADGPAAVPAWPGDAGRKQIAEAVTRLLRDWLAKGRPIDGVFALRAAEAQLAAVPARPSDYVDGCMLIARQAALDAFKRKVTRWLVWNFPPTKKYNYPYKLDYSPGRSVLMVLIPKDLPLLQQRFAGKADIQAGLGRVLEALEGAAGVVLALPRRARGYVFITAAKGPEAMQQVAAAFFELERIPDEPVLIE